MRLSAILNVEAGVTRSAQLPSWRSSLPVAASDKAVHMVVAFAMGTARAPATARSSRCNVARRRVRDFPLLARTE